jgi:hypothetical protein
MKFWNSIWILVVAAVLVAVGVKLKADAGHLVYADVVVTPTSSGGGG